MPTPPPSITLDPAPHPALSHAGLRAEGLELLGRLCGDQWSDFNTHDPGITILEQLCFALTELAYRSQWPMEDLLASAGADWQPAAAEILSGDPVTRDDLVALLRALGCQAVVVDGVDQPDLPLYFRPSTVLAGGAVGRGGPPVAGDLELEANLETSRAGAPPQPVTPQGIWRVTAQLGSGEPDQGPASLLPIARRLHGTRLLGRDFALEVLTPFEVVVRVELELASPAATPGLMERLRSCLDAVITEVGSAAAAGGLRSAALIQALDTQPEVRRVISLELACSLAGPFHPWHLPLPGRGARLHPASPIRLSHRGLPLEPPPALPAAARSAAASALALPAGAALAAAPPAARPGRRRQLSGPRSLARLLPAVYGVGPAGLPADATPERRALALQLRAYLLFFDQLLANGEAQLANAAQLLAPVDPSDPHPLDAEAVSLASDRELPLTDLTDLLRGTPAHWQDALRQALRASAPSGAASQRAALLAHLLRRFGEELDLEAPLHGADQAGPITEQELATRLVMARSEFLRRIVPLTGGRGSGPDLLAGEPDPQPLALAPATETSQGPFAERLRRKLGLPLGPAGAPSVLVIEHLLLRPLPDDSSQRVQGGEDPIPFLSDVARPDPWSGRVSVVINAALLPAMTDADRDRWLVRLLRQELPAHLRAELHLLADDPATPGQGPWSALVAAWCRFRALLHTHRLAALGGDQGAADSADPLQPLLLSLRLRDSRDRLLSLLRIGLPWPLRAIPLPEQMMVASGQAGAVVLPYSQKGVCYQLVEVASGARVGDSAEGTDGPLTLITPPIREDVTLRVLASVLPPRASDAEVALTANGRARSTLLAGEIRVVEGIDVGLSLRLLDLGSTPLPLLHPEGSAVLADHGQRLVVEIDASQEGVVYEVIDNDQRGLPFNKQTSLSDQLTGNSSAIRLEVVAAAEDRDLAVRASLEKWRGRSRAVDSRVLSAILPLRVRANPEVPLRLLTPVVNAEAPTTVAIGATPATGAHVSQKSVRYLLHARLLNDADWRFDNPAIASEITTVTGPLEGFTPQSESAVGNGKVFNLQQTIGGEGMVVAALARKEHRLSPRTVDDPRTHPSEVPLRQAAVAYTRPDAGRRVFLRRDPEGPSLWSLWGGQPGVAYTLRPDGLQGQGTPLAPPLAMPEPAGAPGGLRGIGRQRVERDLVVDAVDSIPRADVHPDPTEVKEPRLWARYLRSGVEVALEWPPILVWAEPPAAGRGQGTEVVVSRLDSARRGRLLRDDTLLREGTADGAGNLRLPTGPLPGATTLLLDVGVGVRCPVPIGQGMNTDLTVRVLGFRPLREGAPAHLLDWGASVAVEVGESQSAVTYALIHAADRDKPADQQRLFSPLQQGSGGPLVLTSQPLREDVDLVVRGTLQLHHANPRQLSGCLQTILPLRVRANPGLPVALVEPVLDPAGSLAVWVGDGAQPSQSSVSYRVWSRPVGVEDWEWANGAEQGTPRFPLPPSIEPPDVAWTDRGQPAAGTDGDPKQGQAGRLRLTSGQAGGDVFLLVVASNRHNPLPMDSPLDGATPQTVTSQVSLGAQLVQLTRPDPGQCLALVAESGAWRLVGGEPGCLYSFLLNGTGAPIGPAVYVHQSMPGDPLVPRGIDNLRLGVDLVVAGAAIPPVPASAPAVPQMGPLGIGTLRVEVDLLVAAEGPTPALEPAPYVAQLRAAGVEARRAFSGLRARLRQGPLLVTVEPPALASSNDTATVVVRGLVPGERARWRQTPPQPWSAAAVPDQPLRLGSGSAPLDTELILEVSREGGAAPWLIPVRVTLPATESPNSLAQNVRLPYSRIQAIRARNYGQSQFGEPVTAGGVYPGGGAFAGGVLLPDGRVFCVPFNSTTARIYDPIANTLATPVGIYPAGGAFMGGVLLPDGRVFCVPFNSTTARIYDPLKDTLITPSGDYPGGDGFAGGVLLQDGRVFCVPRQSATARIYDPSIDALVTPSGVPLVNSSSTLAGGVLLPDGRVFCVPSGSTSARIYDPEKNALVKPSGNYPGGNAFFGGVLLPDGRVFCVPRTSTTARIYDPVKDLVSTPSGSYSGSCMGGVLLADGRVFCVQEPTQAARIYDPVMDCVITPPGIYDRSYCGGVLLFDGRIFCVPHGQRKALIVGSALSVPLPAARVLSPYDNTL